MNEPHSKQPGIKKKKMIRKKLAQSDLIDTNYLFGHENDLFLHKKQKYINKPAKNCLNVFVEPIVVM